MIFYSLQVYHNNVFQIMFEKVMPQVTTLVYDEGIINHTSTSFISANSHQDSLEAGE